MTRRRGRSSGGSTSGNDAVPPPKRYRYATRSRTRRAAMLGGDQEGRKTMVTDEEHRQRQPTLKVVANEKALTVKSVGKNVMVNADAHFTTDYETDDLVVRRGSPFDLTLAFDRAVNAGTDVIALQFSVGARPQETKGTLIRLKLDIKDLGKVTALRSKWCATVSSVKEDSVTVAVCPPASATVGKYQVHVETHVKGKDDEDEMSRYEWEDTDVVVIFNPWCKEDVVYMENEKERDEYVLNDHGRIWVGSAGNNSGRPWNFGQFDNPCLDAALLLLDRAELTETARHSPISIVRAISAQANSMDDNGVLEGRWTDKYPKVCTLPWAWTGSVRILQQFMDTGKPVKYGQCWVFSGLVTTLLRALGIPTRSITNFESAHDCDASMTIDSHFDEDDEPLHDLNDSTWNFHVWNESWFRRQDLPDGYDGWQAHDATPQELSEGVMRCGPAPLRAIKEGHVYLNYDIPFIFGEVNGDKVHWKRTKDGDMEVLYLDAHAVGKEISTKSVGSNWRNDVTHDYKYPEGSTEERRVVEFVNRFSNNANENIYNKDLKKDVTFTPTLPTVMIGEDVVVTLAVKNAGEAAHKVQGRMSVLTSFYTGVAGKRLDGDAYTFQLAPQEEKTLELKVTAEEYQGKLNPEASLQFFASFHVVGTKQRYAATRPFSLKKPELQITVPEDMTTGVAYEGTASFTNPLSVSLTNAKIMLEGASVMSADFHEFTKPIKSGETVSFSFALKARRSGRREIEGTFSSDQLCGVDGSNEFEVKRNVQPMDTN